MRILTCLAVLLGPVVVAAADPAPDYNRDVRPILSDRCFFCHGPDVKSRRAGLRLDTAEGAARVLKGDRPEATEFVRRITSTDPDEKMPPAESNISKRLSPRETAVLRAWVAAGAPYERHWAYVTPTRPALPDVADPAWQKPIDRFVAARMAREGLRPSPEADRVTLLRRVTLDLTGLPPTPAELEAYLSDPSPDAYVKAVDRLLASPRFGERMAVAWLDLARYGDSSVYHADGPRDMWGWRDWVIRAFNENMPFDRFTVEQIAGDLLPNATPQQKVASGFNRNHATTDEGGVIPEEFRVDYVVDRVKTVSNTWMAVSLECGQCHDHKYDPITQREYYQFYAYFNNTKDAGMQTRNGNSAPLVEVPDPQADATRRAAREARLEVEGRFRAHRDRVRQAQEFRDWLAKQKAAKGTAPAALDLAFQLPCDETGIRLAFPSTLDGKVGMVAQGKLAETKRPGGNGLALKGNALVEIDSDFQIDGHKPFTFAAWVKIPANAGGPLLTRMAGAPTYRGFDIGLEGGRPGLHLVHRWSGDALKVYAKSPLKPNTWQHLVITSDGSGKAAGITIRVDGRPLEKQVSADTLKGATTTPVPLRLGGRGAGPYFNAEVDDLCVYLGTPAGDELRHAALDPVARLLAVAADRLAVTHLALDPVSRLLAVPADRRTPAQTEWLFGRYLRSADKEYTGLLRSLAQKRDAERKVGKGLTSVMVMEDLPANQMRTTYILNRGQYDQPMKDKPVQPGIPAAFPPLPEGAPANRLGLARWLVRPDHPLTARVAVNRFWQLFLGEGLVRTTEDFGRQGEVPSHPDLLDWLAVDFVEHGWDVKRLVKQLVTSATYRQDSRVTPELLERDPENRLLARGPRYRLQAEFVRDGALFVAGLLVEHVGGPSVKPYQPAGVWEEVALDTNLSKYVQDHGDKLYRRSMYTYWKRSAPPPSMMTFDAPSREKCTGSRPRTNTPLQALVTLNDPQFVEASRAFAQRILKQGGTSPEDRVRFAVLQALGRPAAEREVQLLLRLADTQLARFRAEPKKAEALLAVGESPRDATLDAAEHAAWTVVANTLINMDEFLVKN